MNPLWYGNPPPLSECVDGGTVPLEFAPKRIENNGLFAGDMSVFDLVGMEIPAHRRVLLAIAYCREVGVPAPYRVNIPGLGTLIYTDRDADTGFAGDNWEIIKS